MYCRQCGSYLPAGADRCQRCGVAFVPQRVEPWANDDYTTQVAPPRTAAPTGPLQAPAPARNLWPVLACALALLVLALGGGVIYFGLTLKSQIDSLSNQSKPDAESTRPSAPPASAAIPLPPNVTIPPLPSVASTPQATAAIMRPGSYPLTLQWIEGPPGLVEVAYRNGRLTVNGMQKNSRTGDLVTVGGTVAMVDDRNFIFTGEITTSLSFQNNGQPCTRAGVMHFRRIGARPFWRLKENLSPCGDTTDYVDIHLR